MKEKGWGMIRPKAVTRPWSRQFGDDDRIAIGIRVPIVEPEQTEQSAIRLVKAKVSRLNGSRYTCKYSGRRRIVIVDRVRCTDVRTLLVHAYRAICMYNERREAGIRVYAPRKEKYFGSLSGSYVTNLHYKNALTNDTLRNIRFADEFRWNIECFFTSVCAAPGGCILRKMTRKLMPQIEHMYLIFLQRRKTVWRTSYWYTICDVCY